MIIVKVMGGLGNQLQQYALYEMLLAKGKEVALDISWFETETQKDMLTKRTLELAYFPKAEYRIATKAECDKAKGKQDILHKGLRKLGLLKDTYLRESLMYEEKLLEKLCDPKDQGDYYVEGYWAAEKYHREILPLLQERLAFPPCNEENQAMCRQIQEDSYPVSMHIRRADYLDAANVGLFGNICTEEYYQGAIAYIKESHPEATIYIFTDDAAYAREHYPEEQLVQINKGQQSFFDIYLMSQCKAHICANSTFSFWGAKLDSKEDKVMIRPWKHRNNQEFCAKTMHELWHNWILIDNQGTIV